MKQPAWEVSIGDRIVDTSRLVSLSLVDSHGLEMDTFSLTLSDQDGKLAIPSKGVRVSIKVGFKDEPLVDRGTFTVDAVSLTGPPDQMVISGSSGNLSDTSTASTEATSMVNQNGSLKSTKTRVWEGQTIGQVIGVIALSHKLQAVVSNDIAQIDLGHVIQNESDVHFVTRLAQDYGAIAAIKAGRLVFMREGGGKSAGGLDLQTITITRNKDQDVHSWRAADRGRYSGVTAFWHNSKTGKREPVPIGSDGYRKHMPHVYADQAQAYHAAQAEWHRLNQKLATMELTLANANPALFTETPVRLQGWGKPQIDSTAWVVNRVTLEIGDQGLSAKVLLETKA